MWIHSCCRASRFADKVLEKNASTAKALRSASQAQADTGNRQQHLVISAVLEAAVHLPAAVSQTVWCAEACAEAIHVPGKDILPCVLDSQQDTGMLQGRTSCSRCKDCLPRQVNTCFAEASTISKHHKLPLKNRAGCSDAGSEPINASAPEESDRDPAVLRNQSSSDCKAKHTPNSLLSVEQLRQKLQEARQIVKAGSNMLHRQAQVLALKQAETAELKQAACAAAADAPAPKPKHPNQAQQAKPAGAGLGLSPDELAQEVQRLTVSIQTCKRILANVSPSCRLRRPLPQRATQMRWQSTKATCCQPVSWHSGLPLKAAIFARKALSTGSAQQKSIPLSACCGTSVELVQSSCGAHCMPMVFQETPGLPQQFSMTCGLAGKALSNRTRNLL